jgi:hypothetical protein
MKCAKCYDAVAGFLDDKDVRITSLESHNRELLAVIAAKDEALLSAANVFEKYTLQISEENEYHRIAKAVDIKPGDIALVEVGYASEPSIQNLINGNDVIVGKKNDIRNEAVYALQKKEGANVST